MMNESSLNYQELAEIARTRASLFAFLNLHFNNLPDQAFIKHIRSDNFQTALADLQTAENDDTELSAGAKLMLDYCRATIAMDTVQLSNTLGVDRTRLYRGISPNYGPPPPYEAVWNKASGGVTAVLQTIAGIYQADGMTVSPNARERLDYIGVELDYLYQLANREAEAWDAGDADQARALLQRQQAFLSEHLGTWVPAFVAKALTMTDTDFYRGHLQMLRGFVTDEPARLQTLRDELLAPA